MSDKELLAIMSAIIASGWVSGYNAETLVESNAHIQCVNQAKALLDEIKARYDT